MVKATLPTYTRWSYAWETWTCIGNGTKINDLKEIWSFLLKWGMVIPKETLKLQLSQESQNTSSFPWLISRVEPLEVKLAGRGSFVKVSSLNWPLQQKLHIPGTGGPLCWRGIKGAFVTALGNAAFIEVYSCNLLYLFTWGFASAQYIIW